MVVDHWAPLSSWCPNLLDCLVVLGCDTVPAVEHSFTCPFCGEVISMVLETGGHSVTYIEDYKVCCNPLEITYTIEDETLVHFEARTLE